MSIFSLGKQLPDLDIVDEIKQEKQEVEEYIPPIVDMEDINGVEIIPENSWTDWHQCNVCKRYWSRKELLEYHKSKDTKCQVPPSLKRV
jgi:hypothetical protein